MCSVIVLDCSGKFCLNGGTLNLTTCECQCNKRVTYYDIDICECKYNIHGFVHDAICTVLCNPVHLHLLIAQPSYIVISHPYTVNHSVMQSIYICICIYEACLTKS